MTFMFFKVYIGTHLSYCSCRRIHFHVHAYLGIMPVGILLSTVQGTKGPFIFLKVQKNSPKYFALNVPKLKGRYKMTDSNSITGQV